MAEKNRIITPNTLAKNVMHNNTRHHLTPSMGSWN